MNLLQKIGCAALESLGGGGGISKFFDRQIELMPDYERTLLANKLCAVMPELTAKFQKIGRYEAWFQTLLVEHIWQSKIRRQDLWDMCRAGVNDSNVTVPKLERNLHNVLDRCVPGYELVTEWVDEEKVEFYVLGELDDARAQFLSRYPNATWPEVDQDALAVRTAAEVEAAEVEAEKDAHYRRMLETFPEVKDWARESYTALCEAERSLEVAKRGGVMKWNDVKVREAEQELKLAQAEDDRCRAAQGARQRVQMQRLKDGLPVYGPDEGPERLETAGTT